VHETDGVDHIPTADVMRDLRLKMIATPPQEFGLTPSEDFPIVYGVVMDWPTAKHVASVVAFSDGNASLYTDSSFGVIGGVGHQAVREQALAFVKTAAAWYESATPTSEFTVPAADRVRFYLLGFPGVRVVETDLGAVERGASPYGHLFQEGQSVLTELRRVAQDGHPKDASNPPARVGGNTAADYLNRLLTSMSEGVTNSIEIKASDPLPNIESLAAGNERHDARTDEQRIDYDSLKSKDVILELARRVNLAGTALLPRRAAFPTVHVLTGGRGVARVFDVTIGSLNRSAKVDLAPGDDPRAIAVQRDFDARSAR
jgi:hypothetical protein